jgi:SAM-dependent methyltransferase
MEPMSFTAHNIVLDDGTQTKPDAEIFVQGSAYRAVERCLRALYPQGLGGVRIADLGCLEGGYAVGLARLGAEVLGIEIRRANYANCCLVKERVNLPLLRFVQDDVWNMAAHGPFDVILCSGVLYHLDRPKRLLEIMARCAGKAVLLNTHFATAAANATFALSELTENEGLAGRWYGEGPPRSEESRWAAWDNARSFWIRKEHLMQAIRDAGFTMVFEQYDWLGDDIAQSMLSGPYRMEDRNLFVGVKV